MLQIKILFNPSSGSRRSAGYEKYVKDRFETSGLNYDFIRTESKEHLLGEAKKAAKRNIDIICVGGDTTFSHVVNMIFSVPGSSSRMGMIGTGSANDITEGLGCGDISDIIYGVKNNHTVTSDIGSFKADGKDDIYFLGTLSAGLGVSVNRYLENIKTKYTVIGKNFSFLESWFGGVAVKRAFSSGQIPQQAQITSKEFSGNVVFSLLLFLNTPLYAKGLRLSDVASPFDGILDCSIIDTGSLLSTFKLFTSVKRGDLKGENIRLLKSPEFRVKFNSPVGIQYDGEMIESVRSMDVSVAKRKLDIFCRK